MADREDKKETEQSIMAEKLDPSPEKWTESDVSSWLRSIGVKEHYVLKLYEEEVDGKILLELDEDFLKKKICMKLGPADLIIKKRNELINSEKKPPKKRQMEDCKARPFDQDPDIVYVKHRVLQPESGAFNLIAPCREFKSLALASTLDHTRLEAKFAHEVLKFATGCMNIRSNGTIYFGVMDSREDKGFVHGEIIGIRIQKEDLYEKALIKYSGKCFAASSDRDDFRQCVRPPRFIEVMDRKSSEKKYVVEVDVVPSVSIVGGKVYQVRLPNFNESTNKVELKEKAVLRRVGPDTEPVISTDQWDFFQRVKDRDAQREAAEKGQHPGSPEVYQDLGRKLRMLIASGKKFIDKDKWFILVTNKFKSEDLCNIDWLLNMNIFCVFDFDPDSKKSGLCSKYLQHHAANMHSLESYRISSDTSIKELTNNLLLFEQTSWIFCNGRTDFRGGEPPCEEMTWIKTKMTFLRESVSLICKHILDQGMFQVIFLLVSPVEKPLLHTFYEFFTDMEGHEDIICICESEENFQKWQSFAEGSCGPEAVNNHSVVGMKMSHVEATLQQIQQVTSHTKHLGTFAKGICRLETLTKEQMYALEILTVDHCDETSKESISEDRVTIERQFYQGGKVTWLHFWLAEHSHVGEVIERDAYSEVFKHLNDLKLNATKSPVNRVNIYHQPGSGGSTVARHVMWNKRKDLRCAVVKTTYPADVVAQHAVKLREHDEKDPQKCLPVLLLVEDTEQEYLDDLRNELEEAIHCKKISYDKPCFILLSCRRSHNPEKKNQESPLENVSVTHKLSPQERRKFAKKRRVLEEKYEPQFILTFVLMSEEFEDSKVTEYLQKFVTHSLVGVVRTDAATRLLLYVALLNTYVQNSYITQSHCEAFLVLTIHLEKLRNAKFKLSLPDPARLILVDLRDEKTYFESIRIIHPKVAEEILKQLLGTEGKQGTLAKELLGEKVLFEHRVEQQEYLKFLKALLMRRSRVSQGDESDTLFSPLIEHVCKNESQDLAIELLKEAYQRFHNDALFAQQIARLYYSCEKFEEAEHWAETAARAKPNNSYILHTKGQVYKKWFHAQLKTFDTKQIPKTAQNTAAAVKTALKAIECFKDCQQAAVSDPYSMHRSGFFAEVEAVESLLKLITSLREFGDRRHGLSECMKYLTTDYIPEAVKDAWEPFHHHLKNLESAQNAALEWLSEDFGYFQTDIAVHEEETPESLEEKKNPVGFLTEKSSVCGKYFSGMSRQHLKTFPSNATTLGPFSKRMIRQLGGGYLTSIFFKLTNQEEKDPISDLETILSLYPSNPMTAKFHHNDAVNYIAAHIALKCLSPKSRKVASLRDLQALSGPFSDDKGKCSPSALFLLTLLFWPEDHDSPQEKCKKYEIVQQAVEGLNKKYWTKLKEVPLLKRRIYTHFYLGNGTGLDKLVHKSKVESVTKVLPVHQKRLKWFRGEAFKDPEIAKMLKSVSGWTADGEVYLQGPRQKFRVQPLYRPSLPHGNENITFYLGFTFRGPVAYDITVTQ